MSVVRESKGITPTYATILNGQLAKVLEVMNGENVLAQYRVLKNLVFIAPQKVRDQLLDRVKEIDQQKKQASYSPRVHRYRRKCERIFQLETTLAPLNEELFREVIKLLT